MPCLKPFVDELLVEQSTEAKSSFAYFYFFIILTVSNSFDSRLIEFSCRFDNSTFYFSSLTSEKLEP